MLRKIFALSLALILCSNLSFAADDEKDKSKDSKDDDSFYHNAGINDIGAIGSRNVGCNRGLFNWYSLDSQVKMGQQFAQQVENSSHLITDPVVNEYINRLGQNLARNSDSHLPFTIKVLDTEDPNAFSLPGGYMFVQAGIILLADDESELAGVMAHEIGHVAACHIARQNTRGTLASLAMIPVIVMTGGLAGIGINEAANIALPATFMKFSRNFEAQADYLGVQYAYKAGYDPNGMITLFEKIGVIIEKRKQSLKGSIEANHPQTPDRIEKTQHEIATILPPREQYIVDTSEFQMVKKRLALIMKHRQLNDKENEQNPDLRRTVNDGSGNPQQQQDGSGSDSGNSGDDRPVIKRKPGNQ